MRRGEVRAYAQLGDATGPDHVQGVRTGERDGGATAPYTEPLPPEQGSDMIVFRSWGLIGFAALCFCALIATLQLVLTIAIRELGEWTLIDEIRERMRRR